jgi:hypothetical protein
MNGRNLETKSDEAGYEESGSFERRLFLIDKRQQERRRGMAQVVEPAVRNPRPFEHRLEGRATVAVSSAVPTLAANMAPTPAMCRRTRP